MSYLRTDIIRDEISCFALYNQRNSVTRCCSLSGHIFIECFRSNKSTKPRSRFWQKEKECWHVSRNQVNQFGKMFFQVANLVVFLKYSVENYLKSTFEVPSDSVIYDSYYDVVEGHTLTSSFYIDLGNYLTGEHVYTFQIIKFRYENIFLFFNFSSSEWWFHNFRNTW